MDSPLYTSFSEKVWKVFPDPFRLNLAVESRDAQANSIFGWSLPLAQKKAVPLALLSDWWCTLVTVHDGHSIWQGLEDEGLPVPQGIYVFDQENGKLVWENPSLRFLQCGPEVVIAAGEEDQVFFLEVATGNVRQEISHEDLPRDFLADYEASRFQGLVYPSHLTPDTGLYHQMKTSFPTDMPQVGPMNYLSTHSYHILHRYAQDSAEAAIEGTLVIYDQDHQLVKTISTGSYENGFALDSFFVMNHWLIWVSFPNTIGRMLLS